jgi:hypothetical protein
MFEPVEKISVGCLMVPAALVRLKFEAEYRVLGGLAVRLNETFLSMGWSAGRELLVEVLRILFFG